MDECASTHFFCDCRSVEQSSEHVAEYANHDSDASTFDHLCHVKLRHLELATRAGQIQSCYLSSPLLRSRSAECRRNCDLQEIKDIKIPFVHRLPVCQNHREVRRSERPEEFSGDRRNECKPKRVARVDGVQGDERNRCGCTRYSFVTALRSYRQ